MRTRPNWTPEQRWHNQLVKERSLMHYNALGTAEIADHLGISRAETRRRIKAGEIAGYNVGTEKAPRYMAWGMEVERVKRQVQREA